MVTTERDSTATVVRGLLDFGSALGVGAVPVRSFDDALSEIIGLAAAHEPLHFLPVGHPRG